MDPLYNLKLQLRAFKNSNYERLFKVLDKWGEDSFIFTREGIYYACYMIFSAGLKLVHLKKWIRIVENTPMIEFTLKEYIGLFSIGKRK